MALNLSSNTFNHHIRYVASTSSWTMSRTDGENGQIPFTFAQAIMDLENIKTGWCFIAEGEFDWVGDESLAKVTPKPTDGRDWKRGFKVNLFSKSLFMDEPLREFCTSATGVVKSIEALYSQFEKERGLNVGKVPVVEFKGSVPLKVGKGNTTVPTLVIIKWVDKPAEMVGATTGQPLMGQSSTPAQNSVSEF